MQIEFDAKKATSNLKKHGISFEEATSCLLDPLALARSDPDARDEVRWLLLGTSNAGRLLAIWYTLRDDETIRQISARRATRKEMKCYAQGI